MLTTLVYGTESDTGCEIIHPCTDFGFKRAMRRPEIAMGFINHMLGLTGPDAVKSIRYVDPSLPSGDPLGRAFTVDVICTTDREKFLLEMQNDFRSDYPDKAFTELCRLVSYWDRDRIHQKVTEGSRKTKRVGEVHDEARDFWQNIKRAVVLVITNKAFSPGAVKESDPTAPQMEPEIINAYRMTHENHPKRYLGDMDACVVLLMLANFHKKEEDLSTDMDRWLYLFKDTALESGVSKIPVFKPIKSFVSVSADDETLRGFYKFLDKTSLAAPDLSQYEEEMTKINRALEERFQEGVKEGEVKGRAEGEFAAKKEMALALMDVLDNETIAVKTKLPLPEIQALRASLQT